MPVSNAYLNKSINNMRSEVTHIGLVGTGGVELSGGSYARKPVTWTEAPTTDTPGLIRPSADIIFNVPAGKVVGWRGYSALTGGTDWGGEDFAAGDQETYANPGELKLKASETALRHEVKTES